MKIIIHLLTLSFLSIFSYSQTKTFLDVPYIEVNGNADTLVTPNEIYISFVISEGDVKDRKSLEDQERRMVAGLKSLGIKTEKNLTTTDMQSDYKFYVLKQRDIFKTKEYKLKVGDAILATRVFMKLEELGIANTKIESVGHSEIESIRNSCRTNAMINAHEKAIALSKPIKAIVGAPLHITDYSSDLISPSLTSSRVKMQNVMMDDSNPEAMAEINFEKIKISISINVKFMLK